MTGWAGQRACPCSPSSAQGALTTIPRTPSTPRDGWIKGAHWHRRGLARTSDYPIPLFVPWLASGPGRAHPGARRDARYRSDSPQPLQAHLGARDERRSAAVRDRSRLLCGAGPLPVESPGFARWGPVPMRDRAPSPGRRTQVRLPGPGGEDVRRRQGCVDAARHAQRSSGRTVGPVDS